MRRADAVALVTMSAGAVHLTLAGARGHHHDGPAAWIDLAFLAIGVALCAAAALALALRTLLPALVASATTAMAYLASRTIGLPGHPAEGWDLVGVATTGAEVAVVAAALPLSVPRLGRRARRLVVAGLVIVTGVPAVAVANTVPPAAPSEQAACAAARDVSLEAVQLDGAGPDGGPRLAYRRVGDAAPAGTPGPLLEMVEGECLRITLVNRVPEATLAALRTSSDHPLGVSLHVHGVKYTQASDGTLDTASHVPPGRSRVYFWYAAPRTTVAGRVTSLGTAGYWWYHDHVVGTSHGTAGVNAGLWGGLIVRRPTDVKPDRTYVVGMGGPGPIIHIGDAARNGAPGKGIVADKGQLVEFLVIGIPGRLAAQDFHEFHLHGHNWADNRTGLLTGPGDETRIIDAKVIGPSESFGFQVRAGEDVGPGQWMLHCHVQEHSDAGMSTFFRVAPGGAAGSTVSTPAAPGHTHVASHGEHTH